MLWGLLPAAASRLRERLLGKRKERIHRSGKFGTWFEKEKRLHAVVFLGGSCVLAGVILFFSFFTVGTTVTYDGHVLGTVASKSEAESVRHELEAITSKTLGETYTLDTSLLQYDSGWTLRQDVEDKAAYEDELSDEIGLVTSAYCLYVNGERIGTTPMRALWTSCWSSFRRPLPMRIPFPANSRRMWRSGRNMSPQTPS